MTQQRGLDRLPEFASDSEIAKALVGSERAAEVAAMFPLFEGEGFPRKDPRFNARYVPAVRRFFDAQYGLTQSKPLQVSGREDLTQWKRPKTQHRG